MIKRFLFLIIVSVLLSACGGDTSETVSEESADQVEVEEEKEEEVEEVQEEEPINVEIDVNENLTFKLFDVTVKRVKVYEKDNSILADINLEWTNKDYQYGDKKSFFVSTLFDVKQGDKDLVEINDAWNPENKGFGNDVFFPNAAGGTWSVDLTYELIDATTPIDIIFTPTTETEGNETITVNIP